ncbi:MAG: hypothetical protein DWQ06_06670 [Calditrichaeota bacterium]|nr:MAG: hypothetical protein DWQ06_06670 [Calditrichota bacterium]
MLKLQLKIWLACLLLSANLFAESKNSYTFGEMNFSAKIVQDSILVLIKAPTKGWLAVGLNSENSIVGSDLKMFRVVSGKVEFEDQFTTGFGIHPQDSELGGTSNVKIISGSENEKFTEILFQIPMVSKDKFDFKIEPNKKFWLILAYSTEDDFQHHSIMRKHKEIEIR